MNKLYTLAIIFLFVWGILLRSVEVINGNYLFGHDHGRDYLAAYEIVEHHKITLIGAEVGSGVAGIKGIFHGPGYFYLIALAYKLFAGDPIGAQLFMLLFGVATMVASFFLGRRILGKLGALLLLFFVSVSPLIVTQSRFIWSSHPLTVFIILSLYFAYNIPKNPRVFAPLALFFAGFTYHFQLGVAVPMVTGLFLALPLIYRIADWKTYVYCVGVLALAYFPMIAFEVRHDFMAIRSIVGATQGSGLGGSILDSVRVSAHFTEYWNNFYNTFVFEFGWIPRHIQMIVLYATLPWVGLGLGWVHGKTQKQFMWALILLLPVTWVGYLFLNNNVWDYYLTHTRMAYIFLYVLAFLSLWRKRKNTIWAAIGLVALSIFLITVGVGSVFRQYISYTVDIHDMQVYEKIYGKRLVIDTIYEDAQGEPFSVFVFMPSVYTHPYDYLFKTYGPKKYGTIPTHKKEGLVYLVIEPDNSQPWRHKGWLETVVNGGHTVWQKTLLNGLMVEKRIY